MKQTEMFEIQELERRLDLAESKSKEFELLAKRFQIAIDCLTEYADYSGEPTQAVIALRKITEMQ